MLDNILKGFSLHRTELMGLSIIGVLIAHIINIGDYYPCLIVNTLLFISVSLFTRCFLLLSGLGLYMSYSNSRNLKDFYSKRVNRLLIPYILMSLPFFLCMDILYNNNILDFILHISTFSFWISGNFFGMWYIAITLALYLLYPIFHNFLFSKKKYTFCRLCIIVFIIIIVRGIMLFFCADYYSKISIGYEKLSFFFVGMYIMFLIDNGICLKWYKVLSIVFITIVLNILTKNIPFIIPEYTLFKILFNIVIAILIVSFMSKFSIFKLIIDVIKWFGIYSLELYILHMLLFYIFDIYLFVHVSSRYLIIISVIIAIIIAKPVNLFTNYVVNTIVKKRD